ncbi:hypothetical protein [Alteromonas oceanisediminis]|uniref:hypothetical protein n=1 Tax=Alteromonas oceanisediminis TaxID=2836180 RepID=UPI001BD974A9|nr:hypothetical protein [Alteromonas oceanisediminis]MBT0584844.1 hypothetical protein [Alteromonas oceanisediminis]
MANTLSQYQLAVLTEMGLRVWQRSDECETSLNTVEARSEPAPNPATIETHQQSQTALEQAGEVLHDIRVAFASCHDLTETPQLDWLLSAHGGVDVQGERVFLPDLRKPLSPRVKRELWIKLISA